MSIVGFTKKTIKTPDGLRLSYRDYGSKFSSKTPVLCLAGLSRSAKDFHAIAMLLKDDRRVLCLDARGRGDSEYDKKFLNYNLVQEVGDSLQVLSAELNQPSIVIGTSRGGLNAMVMNQVRGDLIAGVVLNDIGPELEFQGIDRILSYIGKIPDPFETWEDAVLALKCANMVQFPELTQQEWMAWARRTYRDEGGRPRLDYDLHLRDAVLAQAEDGGIDFWPQYRALKETPCLLVRGEYSDLLSEMTTINMRRVKPDLTAVTIRERGHAPFLDEEESVQAIQRFVQKVDNIVKPF